MSYGYGVEVGAWDSHVKRMNDAFQRMYQDNLAMKARGITTPYPSAGPVWAAFNAPAKHQNQRAKLVVQAFDKALRMGLKFPPYVHEAVRGSRKFAAQKPKSFWETLGDGAMSVMKSPVFNQVCGAATAAIPGVGPALAPIATKLQSKVTEIVDKARHGHLASKDILSGVVEIAAAGASAAMPSLPGGASLPGGLPANIPGLPPGAGTIINKAKTVSAVARSVASPKTTKGLRAARQLIIAAKAGSPKAQRHLLGVMRAAQAGDKQALKAFALVTATAHGMRTGHVPVPSQREAQRFVECVREEREEEDSEDSEEYEEDDEVSGATRPAPPPPKAPPPPPKLNFTSIVKSVPARLSSPKKAPPKLNFTSIAKSRPATAPKLNFSALMTGAPPLAGMPGSSTPGSVTTPMSSDFGPGLARANLDGVVPTMTQASASPASAMSRAVDEADFDDEDFDDDDDADDDAA